jgi:hypothetical protein
MTTRITPAVQKPKQARYASPGTTQARSASEGTPHTSPKRQRRDTHTSPKRQRRDTYTSPKRQRGELHPIGFVPSLALRACVAVSSPGTAALLLGLLLTASLEAAPPALTSLYPAGAQRGTTVEVTATGTFERWPVHAWASHKGVEVKTAKTKGKLSVTVAADVPPGTCWLRLHDDQGASSLRPFLIGSLPEIMEKASKGPSRPQPVDLPVVVNGKLARSGEVDSFALKLKKGQTLVAALEANDRLKSPMDGVLQVVSTDGFVLGQNNDFHGLDPQLSFPVSEDGTYLIRVFAFPSTPDSGIRFAGADTFIYRLTLTTGGYADHALPLAVSRSSPGAVEMAGWNIPTEARRVSVPEKANGETVSLFSPSVANPVQVRLEPHPCLDLTRKSRPADPLLPPFSATGRLSRPDTPDVVTFTGRKGQALSIQVESRSLGLPLTPVLRILDASGKQLARAESRAINQDCSLTVTPTQSGTFRAEVADLYGGSGERYVYLLRVTPPRPDFDLTVAVDRFVISPGKTLDVPVTVNRRNGFSGDVELSVAGLPAGVTAPMVMVGKSASKATVRLTAGKETVSGSFRIIARVKGHQDLIRPVRASLAEFGETTADLWLTASATATAPKPPRRRRRK